MSFPPDFLEEIKTRLPVSIVVGRSVKLSRRGREFLGISPFTNEKTPSFTINDEKGFYHCFSSGEHGDIFTFVMKTQSLSFPEAVERLAEEVGLEIPTQTPEDVIRSKLQANLRDIVEEACHFFEQQLRSAEGKLALDYLQSRGLSDKTLRKYRLGYAPAGNVLKSALMREGVSEEVLLRARLISKGQEGRSSFDFFRDRVMFPINDSRGRPIAFGGRVLAKGEPKYLNSPETPLFHKGRVLYGFSQAREEAAKSGEIIVVEGYMDVLALHEAGHANVVAPLGTALTESQIQILWRLAPEPIVCFDGDAAGRRAAARSTERVLPILKPGLSLRYALLPPGKDPDDIVRLQGKKVMSAILQKAVPLSEIVWRQLLEGRAIDTPERRAALEKASDEVVACISEASVSSQYRYLFREKLFELFRGGRGGSKRSGQNFKPSPTQALTMSDSRENEYSGDSKYMRERILMATLLNHPDLLEHVEERLGSYGFSDSRLDTLRQSALKSLISNPDLDFEALTTQLSGLGFRDELKALLTPTVYVHAGFARLASSLADATEGWDHTFVLCQQEELEADIQRAEESFLENPSEETYEIFRSLKNQKRPVDVDVDEIALLQSDNNESAT